MQKVNSPIILALDTDELDTAVNWIEATAGSVDVFKVGLEFFLKHGAAGLLELRNTRHFELFLDLKLHDIPNTVAGAVRSIRELQPRFLTVHASGGSAMIKAAAEAGPAISITAVTVLTSLDQAELSNMGIALPPLDFAVSLARNAVASGARAIVCSPMEVTAIRSAVGSEIEIITPGVRPADSELGDQSRVMTPRDAIIAGADYLVIGRPITSYYAQSPQAMRERSQQILESLS
ncbi:MAG: orotidine-5'-phosphate decarboxylase [Actinomycetes bacterium]|jgi:orotidine-5'-phosphate decarboxylase